MKRKFIFGVLCFLSLNTLAKAESVSVPECLEPIIKDGVFYVDELVPTSEQELSNINYNLPKQYSDFLKDDENTTQKRISLVECSEDYSKCTLAYLGCEVGGGCGTVPVEVNVKWKEDTLGSYSDTFNKVAPNGVFNVKAVSPIELGLDEDSLYEYLDFAINGSVKKIITNVWSSYSYLSSCNDDYSNCRLNISLYDKEGSEAYFSETHSVKVAWEKMDYKTLELVNNYIKKYDEKKGSIIVDDLNLLNYYVSVSKSNLNGLNNVIYYSKDMKELFDNDSKLSYDLDMRMGDASPMNEWGAGALVFYYDGIAYGYTNGGVAQRGIIYIPDEIENTKEAYITAAQKRINEYFGNSSVKITVAEALADFEYGIEYFEEIGDVSKMGDYYYNVTIGDLVKPVVIIRDSSKLKKPVMETKDVENNITISSEDASLPLDIIVEVEEVKEGTPVFNEIKETLKFAAKEEVQIYDFKLFSQTLNDNISKLETGEFRVSIPIKSSLIGKKLSAYYIDGDKVEEHPVEVDENGIGTFTTTHFSIYTIAERRTITENGVVVPNTFDGITNYIILGISGLVILTGALVYLKKCKN